MEKSLITVSDMGEQSLISLEDDKIKFFEGTDQVFLTEEEDN